MSGITLATAQANLDAALAALQDARGQQEYQIASQTGSRKVVRGNLADLQSNVEFWDKKVKALSRGGGIRTYLAGASMSRQYIAKIEPNWLDKIMTIIQFHNGGRPTRRYAQCSRGRPYPGAPFGLLLPSLPIAYIST